jgi:hypothetical protein
MKRSYSRPDNLGPGASSTDFVFFLPNNCYSRLIALLITGEIAELRHGNHRAGHIFTQIFVFASFSETP